MYKCIYAVTCHRIFFFFTIELSVQSFHTIFLEYAPYSLACHEGVSRVCILVCAIY